MPFENSTALPNQAYLFGQAKEWLKCKDTLFFWLHNDMLHDSCFLTKTKFSEVFFFPIEIISFLIFFFRILYKDWKGEGSNGHKSVKYSA